MSLFHNTTLYAVTVVLLLLTIQPSCAAAFVVTRNNRLRSSHRISAAPHDASSVDVPHQATALRSMTFCNLDKTKQPQLLCDFLMESGACSTSIIDADRDTPLEQAIYREPDATVIIREDAAVRQKVWNRCNVTAHFAASANLQLVADMVSKTLGLPLGYDVLSVPDRDWVVHVQQSWKPIVVSGLVLRFPWHSQQDVQEIVGDLNVVEVELQGGIAFGTGEHPTTQMCLEWIQNLLAQDDTITNFLDFGSGSGVLGLAACALSNNTIKAVGVDIDVDAVRIANANAETNGFSMMSYLPPLEETCDSESKSLLMKAHQISNSEILPDNEGLLYDACVANILAGPLVTLAPTLASMVKPNGYLGLSGILESQSEMIIDAYSEYFDNVRVENERGGWILVTGTRKA